MWPTKHSNEVGPWYTEYMCMDLSNFKIGWRLDALQWLLNMRLTSQQGHTKLLMFSTTPNTLTPIFRQKFTSFRTVAKATSWGVVTMMAPSGLTFFRSLTIVICSSLVPGGVSVGKKRTYQNNNNDIISFSLKVNIINIKVPLNTVHTQKGRSLTLRQDRQYRM